MAEKEKRGRGEEQRGKLQGRIDHGFRAVAEGQEQIEEYVDGVKRVEATLDPGKGSSEQRKERFQRPKRRPKRGGR